MSTAAFLLVAFSLGWVAQSLIALLIYQPICGPQVAQYVRDQFGVKTEFKVIMLGIFYGAGWTTFWAFICRFVGLGYAAFWGVWIGGQLLWVARIWLYSAGIKAWLRRQQKIAADPSATSETS